MNPTSTQSKPRQIAPSAPAPSASAPKTAKLFKNGRSQAVRLPKEFRFEGTEVTIRQNPTTGEVVLAPILPEPGLTFDDWFALYDAIPDDASEEEFAKLPPSPKNLTNEQLFKIIESANFPADFMADRKTSMPRKLDIF
jgi:antitoxin VapB